MIYVWSLWILRTVIHVWSWGRIWAIIWHPATVWQNYPTKITQPNFGLEFHIIWFESLEFLGLFISFELKFVISRFEFIHSWHLGHSSLLSAPMTTSSVLCRMSCSFVLGLDSVGPVRSRFWPVRSGLDRLQNGPILSPPSSKFLVLGPAGPVRSGTDEHLYSLWPLPCPILDLLCALSNDDLCGSEFMSSLCMDW